MTSKTTMLTGTALLAGTMLLASSAFAQYQSQSGTPSAGTPPSQPSTAEPATSPQPSMPADQNTGTTGQQGQQQMNTPQSSSQNATTMSASAGEPLSKVKDAKTTLASATVQDSSGQQIGQVANVHTTKHGTATTIDVTLQSSGGTQPKTVAIKASKLRYDESSKTLKSDLTSSELQSLPSATSM